ncbi:MAG: Holliday junction branch migration protein RuvA [Proteobacteria bacterium]|nr:Holliday junction branch migration protein RuvA [Pseudomonadota bacterium]MDA1309229.1 Holliday junction branch migration protein RuvA [Pseudomonadota bacterium]
MIAKLKGILDSHRKDGAVIDVGGVGYLIFGSSRTLGQLGDPGAAVSVHVETHVREDHIHLYGFATESERRCFQVLQTVQGVGAKAALAILSALSPEEVMQSVAAQDKTMLTRADGVGPKLATRIVNELKDKAVGWSPGASLTVGKPGAAAAVAGGSVEDAVSALVNLGYGRSDAYGAVAAASRTLGDGAALDRLISTSLRELAS